MSLGARLKELRIQNNQSLQDVADAVGASKAHIWDIERGASKNPSMELLNRLASHFKTSVTKLVGEDVPDEETEEVIALYRDLKDLAPQDRETIRSLMRRLRETKGGT